MEEELDIEALRQFLDQPFWIPTLECGVAYSRIRDDDDGSFEGDISVLFDMAGDARVSIGLGNSIRFRAGDGGGRSLRTRAALMILAEAIRLDNEKRPIEIPMMTLEIPKCACGKPLNNDPTDNKEINGKVVCEDCYSKAMDTEIEQHGVVSPGYRGPGGAH